MPIFHSHQVDSTYILQFISVALVLELKLALVNMSSYLLYICLQVKIIKCLVENIVVDISFNQLGGLCTLCFLEEVSSYISSRGLPNQMC